MPYPEAIDSVACAPGRRSPRRPCARSQRSLRPCSPEDELLFRPRYNAAPSDTLWILRHGGDRRVIAPAIWGYRAKGRPLINVRGESVGAGGFREAFASRRWGVVVDGFFEWNKLHEPTWFHRSDGGLIVLGGLYQIDSVVGGPLRFTILTTRPNRLVAAVHDRMPLLVPSARIDDWLTDESPRGVDLIGPAPDSVLVATPVSQRVNSVRNDDPECLQPVEHRGDTQRSLF
jgi:putative SOS response-associated peptidase YedK